jgi:hypothetical protein
LADAFLEAYQPRLHEVAHQILVWGYQGARAKIHENREEEEITGFLLDAMHAKLSDPDIPAFYDHFEPHGEWRVSTNTRTGKARQRIDIVIRRTRPRPRVGFAFEAKRLRANGHPIGDYTGAEGMLCFLRCDYAQGDPEAAMLGYVQSDDAARWFGELEKKFKDNSATLACTSPLAKATVITELSDEWVSEHRRTDGTALRLYHIFLDCIRSSR